MGAFDPDEPVADPAKLEGHSLAGGVCVAEPWLPS
jgi:hypothetical protein